MASLLVAFAIFVILTFTGYFYSTGIGQTENMPLGETSVISLKENQSNSISFGFGGGILPGQEIPTTIDVLNDSENDLYIRAKVFILSKTDGVIEVEIKSAGDWIKRGEYYYFLEKVLPQERVNCLTAIQIPMEVMLEGRYIYNMNVLVESLSDYEDVQKLWGGLPETE